MEKMKTLLMSICLLLVSAVSFAQVEEASGNVTDNSGEPVIGATVIVVGGQGNAGTVTDIDGNFTVQVIRHGLPTCILLLVICSLRVL